MARRDGRSAVGADVAVDDAHRIAFAPLRQRVAVQRVVAAVFHAYGDFVAVVGIHIAFDLVAGDGAADGAGHRGQLPAVAAADLVAQQAAEDGAASRAGAAALAAGGDFTHRGHHAAAVADLRHLLWRRIVGRWRGCLHRLHRLLSWLLRVLRRLRILR